MPRRPKQEVIIPTTATVASAVRYPGKAARIYRPSQDWQRECYRHYAICGEARFAARFFAHAMSRATLGIVKNKQGAKDPVTQGPSVDTLALLFAGGDGQAEMLEAAGMHLTVAGEFYLVGRTVTDEESGETRDLWEIVSVMEMKVAGDKWTIHYGDKMQDVPLTEEDVVIRVWIPNPARRVEADSPFRSLLPILAEIEWLTRHIFAQVSSRLAGAGLLMLPQGMSFPPPPDVGGEVQQTANDADAFMLTLADAMLRPIEDPSSPSAMVPIVITAPDDAIDKAKLLHFWSELDGKSLEMRVEAIRRFALGMELPPEQVLGMSSNSGSGGGRSNGVSHWGAWQIEESTIKMFIEPMLELFTNSLTMQFLWPLTNDTTESVSYSTAALRLRPDRSKEAFELYDRGQISGKVLLRENGFDDSDAMQPGEFRQWLLVKVAGGSATPDQVSAALKVLGVDLGITPAPAPTREARPVPTLEEHPSNPRTPDLSALLAASDALVFRALERAGNRIRQTTGSKPPGVPSYEMHTLHHVNGKGPEFLDDAWSCASKVLDGIAPVESTVQMLNAYCLSLFASGEPHTRDRLRLWLAVSQ